MRNLLGKRVVARFDGAGVFYGTLSEVCSEYVTLTDVRRLRYWQKVAGGTTGLANAKKFEPGQEFSGYVEELVLLKSKMIELNKCSDDAIKAIEDIGVWI